jgi:hypothetical protein
MKASTSFLPHSTLALLALLALGGADAVAEQYNNGQLPDPHDFLEECPAPPPDCGSCGSGNVTYGPTVTGLPQWRVSEPYVNLWLTDVPLGYRPAKGPAVAFKLSYKQRETVRFNVFSIGARWNCAWLSYVDMYFSSREVLLPSGGLLKFPDGATEYFTGARLEDHPSSGYQIVFPSGTTNVYQLAGTDSKYYLTAIADASGNSLTLEYEDLATSGGAIRLLRVIDADGGTNTLYYTNHVWSANLISHVVDRFGPPTLSSTTTRASSPTSPMSPA